MMMETPPGGMGSMNENGPTMGDGGGEDQKDSPMNVQACLHFLQGEWNRTAKEKLKWDLEKAELEARVAFLESERQSKEALVKDLIRRIKMLECALRQERNGGVPPEDVKREIEKHDIKKEHIDNILNGTDNYTNPEFVANVNKSRNMLRAQLKDLNLDYQLVQIRNAYLKSLQDAPDNQTSNNALGMAGLSGESLSRLLARKTESELQTVLGQDIEPLLNSVAKTEDFLPKIDDDTEAETAQFEQMMEEVDLDSAPTVEMGSSTKKMSALEHASKMAEGDVKQEPRESKSAQRTVMELSDDDRFLSSDPKVVLRGHYGPIRCSKFHPNSPLLLTGSDDHMVKVWNLSNIPINGTKKDVDFVYTFMGHRHPVTSLTLSHSGELVFTGDANGHMVSWLLPPNALMSVPGSDPFPPYDSRDRLHTLTLDGSPLITFVSTHPRKDLLMVGSADGRVRCVDYSSSLSAARLWEDRTMLVNPPSVLSTTVLPGNDAPLAMSSAGDGNDSHFVVAGAKSSALHLLDIETNTVVREMSYKSLSDASAQETLPVGGTRRLTTCVEKSLVLAACTDGMVRVFDARASAAVGRLPADAPVVCVDASSDESFVALGTAAGGVRFWSLAGVGSGGADEFGACLQDLPAAHPSDEGVGVFNVEFHRQRPFVSSCGVDSVKIYV